MLQKIEVFYRDQETKIENEHERKEYRNKVNVLLAQLTSGNEKPLLAESVQVSTSFKTRERARQVLNKLIDQLRPSWKQVIPELKKWANTPLKNGIVFPDDWEQWINEDDTKNGMSPFGIYWLVSKLLPKNEQVYFVRPDGERETNTWDDTLCIATASGAKFYKKMVSVGHKKRSRSGFNMVGQMVGKKPFGKMQNEKMIARILKNTGDFWLCKHDKKHYFLSLRKKSTVSNNMKKMAMVANECIEFSAVVRNLQVCVSRRKRKDDIKSPVDVYQQYVVQHPNVSVCETNPNMIQFVQREPYQFDGELEQVTIQFFENENYRSAGFSELKQWIMESGLSPSSGDTITRLSILKVDGTDKNYRYSLLGNSPKPQSIVT